MQGGSSGSRPFLLEFQMKQFPVLNFVDFIAIDGDELKTDSLKVAAVHGKRHDDVLKLIRKRIKDSGSWGVRNFAETPYIDSQNGQSYPKFNMTKDGYQFLVGKMSGKKAVEHQIAFIEAFNAMAAYIKNQREGLQYQYFRKELEYQGKKSSVSGAAKEMRKWQDDKPVMLNEMDCLLSQMQPTLLPN
jgi:Rha family phage regulatory protein